MSCALGEVCSSSLLFMADSKYENETPLTPPPHPRLGWTVPNSQVTSQKARFPPQHPPSCSRGRSLDAWFPQRHLLLVGSTTPRLFVPCTVRTSSSLSLPTPHL